MFQIATCNEYPPRRHQKLNFEGNHPVNYLWPYGWKFLRIYIPVTRSGRSIPFLWNLSGTHLGEAWICGNTCSSIASLIALWICKLTLFRSPFISWVILWFNSPDHLLISLLKSISPEVWPFRARRLISFSPELDWELALWSTNAS